MFQRALSWMEIGIAEFTADPRVAQFTKGSKFCWRREDVLELKSVEVALRQLLEKYTFKVDGFYPYRWLPVTAYKTWREKHDALVARGLDIKARMIASHHDIVDEIADEYAAIAEAAWTSITGNGLDYVLVENKKTNERVPFNHEQFVSTIVDTTVKLIPTQDEIEAKLNFDYVTAMVQGQEDMAADEAAAAKIRGQVTLEREFNALEVSAKAEELRSQAWMNQIAQRERQIQLDAMREAEAEHARAQLKQMVDPFAEVFTALRSQFAQDAADILESVKKNGFVRGKVAERGRGLIEMFDLMAVQDDYELRGKLMALKNALGPVSVDSPARDTEQVKALLEEVMELERQAADDLQSGPNRFNMLDV
jgi:hypothetical protein